MGEIRISIPSENLGFPNPGRQGITIIGNTPEMRYTGKYNFSVLFCLQRVMFANLPNQPCKLAKTISH